MAELCLGKDSMDETIPGENWCSTCCEKADSQKNPVGVLRTCKNGAFRNGGIGYRAGVRGKGEGEGLMGLCLHEPCKEDCQLFYR